MCGLWRANVKETAHAEDTSFQKFFCSFKGKKNEAQKLNAARSFMRTYTKHGLGPWTTSWTWSMDHFMYPVHGPLYVPSPWTTPNFQIVPVNLKIYRRSGYEKHGLVFIAYVLEAAANLDEREGAGASYVIRQPTPSKVTLRLIRKLNTFCALSHWNCKLSTELFSSIYFDYKFVFVGSTSFIK